jgi:hypothetical protein
LKGNSKAIKKATVDNASLGVGMCEGMNEEFHMRYPQKKMEMRTSPSFKKKLLYKA